jgi:hypothetical protein
LENFPADWEENRERDGTTGMGLRTEKEWVCVTVFSLKGPYNDNNTKRQEK